MRQERALNANSVSQPAVVIVGAGIVGLATAYHLIKGGSQVTVVDRDPEGDKASYGNAGGIAVTEVMPASAAASFWRLFGWMINPLGPLTVRPAHALSLVPWLKRFTKAGTPQEIERLSHALASINSRVYQDLLPLLGDCGLTGQLRSNGGLFLYETESGYRRDAEELACKRSRGVVLEDITVAEARSMEPALGGRLRRAVYAPQWAHVGDPKQLVQGIKAWLLSRGVTLIKNEVRRITSDARGELSLELEGGYRIVADRAIVAAGAWSAMLARRLGDRVLLESERGYNSTLPAPNITLQRQLIFAERKFVATPLDCGLRIGGAAEFGGLHSRADFRRSQTLLELARLYLPELRIEGGSYWAGHRPATPDSLPVIGTSRLHPSVIYAFGHGHLGLTQAATTGKLVSELVFQKPTSIDLAPFTIARFR